MKREFDCDPAWNWRIEKNRITLRMRYSIQAADGVVSRAPLPPYIRVSRTALSHSVVLRTLGRGVLSFISPLFHIWVLSFEIIEKTTRVLRKLTTRLVSPRQFSRLFWSSSNWNKLARTVIFYSEISTFKHWTKLVGDFKCVAVLSILPVGHKGRGRNGRWLAITQTDTQKHNTTTKKPPKTLGIFLFIWGSPL